MESLENIDHFFKGQPTVAEKEKFEQRILSDPAFAADVSFYIATMNAAKEQSDTIKKEDFRKLEKGSAQTGAAVVLMRFRLVAVAAAVVIAISLVVYFYMKPADTVQLADQYISQNLQVLPVKMSGQTDSIEKGIRLYNDAKTESSLKYFQDMLERAPGSETALKYAGIAALQSGQYDLALQYFTRLENISGLYANPGKFYKALTLLKRNLRGDNKLSRELLQEVVRQDLEGKETAEKWLKKI
ncbi:MAG TPA: hypothetical protein VM012_13245 [Flavitalea sp.]|nr:hypothetical protein [Flavitalea sp.]